MITSLQILAFEPCSMDSGLLNRTDHSPINTDRSQFPSFFSQLIFKIREKSCLFIAEYPQIPSDLLLGGLQLRDSLLWISATNQSCYNHRSTLVQLTRLLLITPQSVTGPFLGLSSNCFPCPLLAHSSITTPIKILSYPLIFGLTPEVIILRRHTYSNMLCSGHYDSALLRSD